jgi:microcystin degradation protein MlrC
VKKRVFVAGLANETNTFSPLFIDRATFESDAYHPPGAHPDVPSLSTAPLYVARRRAERGEIELIEGTMARANPAGLVSRSAYESLRDEILDQVRAALPLDVVMFALHGAMVADGYDDCEGDLMARTREIVGEACIIGCELDPHCHLTDLMVQAANVIIAFKEFPHTDFLARAEDLADLCLSAANGEVTPVMSVFDCRAITGFMTSREPGRSFVDRLMAMEGKDGILSITIAHGFQAADVYDVGTKVLAITDNDPAKGAALAETLGREILSWPESAQAHHYKPEEAIAYALTVPGQPVVFGDRWDNPGGGVGGDSTVMVNALLAHPEIPSAIGAMWDPVAVSFCRAAGPGTRFNLRFGGKAAASSGQPVDAEVVVRATTPDLVIPFEQSMVSLGAAAAITIGNLDVVLATGRAQSFSPAVFTSLGIDLSQKKIVVVKSSNHFYAAFAPIAAEVQYLDSGGPYPSDPRRIPYTKVRRPIWPLDPNPWL